MRSAIDGFVEGLGEIYEGELESVWMGGSGAREFGNPETSDVDLLLVTKRLNPSEKRVHLLKLVKSQSLSYDITAATIDHINADLFPTPVDFLLKEE